MKNKDIKFGFIGAGQISHPSAKAVNEHEYASVLAALEKKFDFNP